MKEPSSAGLMKSLYRVFRAQARDAAAKAKRTLRAPDLTHWIGPTADAVKPHLLQFYGHGALLVDRDHSPAAVAKALKAGRKYSPRVLDAVDEISLKISRETLETARGRLGDVFVRLRRALKKGLSRGDGIRALTKAVQKIFADPYRAYRIARTESWRAIQHGKVLRAEDLSYRTVKVWETEGDGKVCPACRRLNGRRRQLDKSFAVVNGKKVQHSPLHVFCRCETRIERAA